MLSVVFRFQLPEISSLSVIHDLLRSFKVEAPCRAVRPPSWVLEAGLHYLRFPIFEPLGSSALRDRMRKTLFSCFGYGQTSRGDPSSVSCGLLFFLECWSFLCSGISSLDRLPCVSFRASFPFSLFMILWPAFLKIFCCVWFASYMSI